MEAFEPALALAREAVQCDTEENYEGAITAYSKTLDEIKKCIPAAKAEEKAQLCHYHEVYKHRLLLLVKAVQAEGGSFNRAELEGKIPTRVFSTLKFSSSGADDGSAMKKQQFEGSAYAPSAYGLSNDDFKKHFQEDVPDEEFVDAPKDNTAFNFWLVRRFRESMDKATWFSPRLVVTPAMWNLKEAKISSFKDKAAFLVALKEALAPLLEQKMQPAIGNQLQFINLKFVIDDAVDKGEKAQSALSKHLNFITDPLPQKQSQNVVKNFFGSFASKLQHVTTTVSVTPEQYVEVLRDTLDGCLALEEWSSLFYLMGPLGRPVTARLERVTDLIQSSLLEFLIRDVQVLMENEMNEGRKNFSRLFK